jgi:hypothetical protein
MTFANNPLDDYSLLKIPNQTPHVLYVPGFFANGSQIRPHASNDATLLPIFIVQLVLCHPRPVASYPSSSPPSANRVELSINPQSWRIELQIWIKLSTSFYETRSFYVLSKSFCHGAQSFYDFREPFLGFAQSFLGFAQSFFIFLVIL